MASTPRSPQGFVHGARHEVLRDIVEESDP